MELSIRDDVAGLMGKRTGYIEGLYVPPKDRLLGPKQQVRSLCKRSGTSVIDSQF